jgi:ABC-type histidine transport system ATPase subunit
MLRRYSKARSIASNSINGDLSNNFKPPNVEVHEKRVQGLAKAVEESQRNANQVRLQMIFQQIELWLNKLIMNKSIHSHIPRSLSHEIRG